MKKYEALRGAILALHDLDQRIRGINLLCDEIDLTGLDEFTSSSLMCWLKNTGVEWPTASIVGSDAAHAAAMIARHADHDVALQHYFLVCMKKSVLMNKAADTGAETVSIAYLSDRINVNLGLPQTYGTQMEEVKSPRSAHGYKLIPRRLAQSVRKTNVLRRQAGLLSIKEQISDMYRTYGRLPKK